jgi:hypothetical protein
MAFGRFASWWALAAVTGLVERWPLDPAELAAAARPLRWMAWDAGEPGTGWLLRLVVEDPRGPRAWALSASDAT